MNCTLRRSHDSIFCAKLLINSSHSVTIRHPNNALSLLLFIVPDFKHFQLFYCFYFVDSHIEGKNGGKWKGTNFYGNSESFVSFRKNWIEAINRNVHFSLHFLSIFRPYFDLIFWFVWLASCAQILAALSKKLGHMKFSSTWFVTKKYFPSTHFTKKIFGKQKSVFFLKPSSSGH